MDKLSILKKIFPSPNATFNERGDEVNGLEKNTVPQNCDIVASGLATSHQLGRQEHYLARVDGALVYTRVCAAMEGSGYDEYAVVHGIAFTEADQLQLSQRASRFIDSCCTPKQ